MREHDTSVPNSRISEYKREEILCYKSLLAMNLMRRIKAAVDPQGIMNPGKVL